MVSAAIFKQTGVKLNNIHDNLKINFALKGCVRKSDNNLKIANNCISDIESLIYTDSTLKIALGR